MKRFILQYWWAPPVAMAALVALSFLATKDDASSFIESIVNFLVASGLIILLVSWVILMTNKQWKKCLYSILITVLAECPLFFILFILAVYAASSDDFGKQHSIPDGMEYSIPMEEGSHLNIRIDTLNTAPCLQIYQGSQGGIYLYDFYYGALPAGDIYLRCYEVTENLQLSEDRIYESSKISVGATYSFSKLVEQQEFTIYEGDWGDYYAARIEVWHKDAQTGMERKLMEKVYRVEGWMR